MNIHEKESLERQLRTFKMELAILTGTQYVQTCIYITGQISRIEKILSVYPETVKQGIN